MKYHDDHYKFSLEFQIRSKKIIEELEIGTYLYNYFKKFMYLYNFLALFTLNNSIEKNIYQNKG